MQMREDFISRTIKTQKLFNFAEGLCCYANVEVTRKIQKSGQDSKIRIANNVCRQGESGLVKFTEIVFGNRIICIEDSYCFKSPNGAKETNEKGNTSTTATNSSEGSQNNNPANGNESFVGELANRKKKMIFKKKNAGDSTGHKIEKRNTKNIAKNFCKAFMLYLEEGPYSSALAKMKEIVGENRFNNKTIEKMSQNSMISFYFKDFLKHRAEEWIRTSKIYDKDIHHEAINLYLQLIESGGNDADASSSQLESKSQFQSDQPYQSQMQDNCRSSNKK